MKIVYIILSISLALNLGMGAVFVKQILEKEEVVEGSSAYMLPKLLELREYQKTVKKEGILTLEVVEVGSSKSANGFAVLLKTNEAKYSFTCVDVECQEFSAKKVERK